MANVQIGGVPYTARTLRYIKNITDERETGFIVVDTETSERFEKYETVDFDGKQFLVEDDDKPKMRNNIYEHRVSIIENIAYFDSVYPASRSFMTRTGVPKKIRNILYIYRRELEHYQGVHITWEEEADWLETPVPNKEYDGLNMSAILVDLFRSINANPKALRVNGEWHIYPQFIDEEGDVIELKTEGEIERMNATEYSTNIRSNIKNAIDEGETSWWPSKSGGVMPRSSQVVRSLSSSEYQLDSRIVGIEKVIAMNVPMLSFKEEETQYFDVDITKYVVTPEERDALPSSGISQHAYTYMHNRNVVLFDLTQNRIYQLYESGAFGFWNVNIHYLRNAINTAARDAGLSSSGSFYYEVEVAKWELYEQKIRVRYNAERNMDVSTTRHRVGMKESTTMHQQRDSKVSLSSYLETLDTMANKLGNRKKTATQTHEGEPYKPGDITEDGFTITKAQYTPRKNYTFAEYELYQDFANINTEYSIRRDPSPFTVTGKRLQTNVIDHVYVRANTEPLVDDNIFTTFATNRIFSSLIDVPAFSTVQMMFRASSQIGTGKSIHMPLHITQGGRNIVFNAHFDHPFVAGYTFDENNDRRPILYTGRAPRFVLNSFRFKFIETDEIIDDGEYPLIDNSTGVDVTEVQSKPIHLGLNDSFAYTMMLSGISDDPRVMIGQGFFKYNRYVRDFERVVELYKSERPYTLASKKRRPTDTIVQGGGYTFTQQHLEVYGTEDFEYWALTINDEIIVSGNGVKDVYFNITKGAIEYQFFFLTADNAAQINIASEYESTTFKNPADAHKADVKVASEYQADTFKNPDTEQQSTVSINASIEAEAQPNAYPGQEVDVRLQIGYDYIVEKPQWTWSTKSAYDATGGAMKDQHSFSTPGSCLTPEGVGDKLGEEHPPNEYPIDFMFQVDHVDGDLSQCPRYYFIRTN